MPHFATDQLVLMLFAGILTWAAVSDLSRYLIPNRVCLSLVILYPAYVLAAPVTPDVWGAILVAAIAFAGGAAMFGMGAMGGGDVKLMAAVALWAGPAFALPFVLTTAVAGGLLAMVMLSPFGVLLPTPPVALFRNGLRPRRAKQSMPYGVAIAAGGVCTAANLLMVG